jgi:hypothetical protein
MAADPQFTGTPNRGVASVSTANTNRDGTGTIVDAWTAGASGGKVEEVVLKATGDPADSIVTMFIKPSGGSYELFDEFDLGDPAAASTTVIGYRISRTYENLVLESGDIIAFAITVALTSGVIKAHVLGGDF